MKKGDKPLITFTDSQMIFIILLSGSEVNSKNDQGTSKGISEYNPEGENGQRKSNAYNL